MIHGLIKKGEKTKNHRDFFCDGEADDVEFQQAIDWVAEDLEHRTATIHSSEQKASEEA